MSIYTSIKISRSKARELILEAMSDDRDLEDMVDLLMREHSYFNCCGIVENGEENDDDKLDTATFSRYDRDHRNSEQFRK